MPTKQETFDHVVKSMIRQGRQCVGDWGCAYRNELGHKCAAGCCIPDELYEYDFDHMCNSTLDAVVVSAADDEDTDHDVATRLLAALDGHDIDLLIDLQSAHDNADKDTWLNSFLKRARAVARDHCLDPSACDWRP